MPTGSHRPSRPHPASTLLFQTSAKEKAARCSSRFRQSRAARECASTQSPSPAFPAANCKQLCSRERAAQSPAMFLERYSQARESWLRTRAVQARSCELASAPRSVTTKLVCLIHRQERQPKRSSIVTCNESSILPAEERHFRYTRQQWLSVRNESPFR